MAVYDQIVTTYSDVTPDVRVVGDVIHMISPYDTPLLAALGGLDAARSKFRVDQNGYKVEILEDEFTPLSTTANHGAAITTNTASITVTDASMFQAGHVILIDAEYMWVSAIDATNNTISVTRTYGGTNATHTTTATIEIVGMARLEGADASYGPVVDITAPYNYTQIFQRGLNVSGTQRVISRYGGGDPLMYQANKSMPDQLRLLEKLAFHGVRAAGSATTPRGAGGLLTFITTNSVNAGGAIAKTDIDNLAEAIYGYGGNPDLFVCNQAIANDVRALIDSSSFVNLTQENTEFGMMPVTRINTQYGSLKMVVSRFCPTATAYILDSTKIGYYTLRPFAVHDIAKVGDSDKKEMVGEFSFLVANDAAHGWIYGLTS